MTLARGLAAEGNSSLSESKIETAEQNATAAVLPARNKDLRRQLSIEQESLKTLTTSLAESNAEAELPMRVMRGEQKIATLRVVDVRQRICGAVIQEMVSEKEQIKVGDRLQVDAHSNVSFK